MGSDLIQTAVRKAGGARKVATALHITTQAVYLYLNGRRPPSDAFLKHIGIERIVTFRKRKKHG